MSEQGTVGRADLQKKDKGELQAIVAALGGKSSSRSRKAELIDQILDLSGMVSSKDSAAQAPAASSGDAAVTKDAAPVAAAAKPVPAKPAKAATVSTKPASAGVTRDVASDAQPAQSASSQPSGSPSPSPSSGSQSPAPSAASAGNQKRGQQKSQSSNQPSSNVRQNDQAKRRRGRNGEPPAEWETDLGDTGAKPSSNKGGQNKGDQGRGDSNRSDSNRSDSNKPRSQRGDEGQKGGRKQDSGNAPSQNNGGQNSGGNASGQNNNGGQGGQNNSNNDDDGEGVNRRRRRRGRSRDRDEDASALEPVAVSGYMELRDDGYGFLRVTGWLQSKDDVYVPVRMVRQCGLRKGDHIVGTARPANRNEKNPAMENIETINGLSPTEARNRPNFDKLTPLFPDERLRLEQTRAPLQITPRIVDLIAPIGKGQRGLIVSPPKAGKTSIMKDIAKSIEKNNPEVQLVVLLIDERPEEVTDMARSLEHGEVVASTFDRPPEEHCALAELTIERAKRLVEAGEDVVILLDGITRLVRAYNMAGPGSGRLMSGGLDTAAIYPPKRFFGAARNLEEGGSLTILATALVETGSRMDEVIFEEFKGTGNMELRLDRSLAERGVFPAINIDGSSTRRPELLSERPERLQVEKLRKVLGALADSDSAPSAGIDLLVDRLKAFKTNKDFLGEIAKM